jgi:hypothetical protein
MGRAYRMHGEEAQYIKDIVGKQEERLLGRETCKLE